MLRDDLRFYCPLNREDEIALARARVRERREGLKVTAALFGGCALAGAGFAVAARLGGGAMANLVPALVILVALPSAGLAVVAISSLIWRRRLYLLAPGELESLVGRRPRRRHRIRLFHRESRLPVGRRAMKA